MEDKRNRDEPFDADMINDLPQEMRIRIFSMLPKRLRYDALEDCSQRSGFRSKKELDEMEREISIRAMDALFIDTCRMLLERESALRVTFNRFGIQKINELTQQPWFIRLVAQMRLRFIYPLGLTEPEHAASRLEWENETTLCLLTCIHDEDEDALNLCVPNENLDDIFLLIRLFKIKHCQFNTSTHTTAYGTNYIMILLMHGSFYLNEWLDPSIDRTISSPENLERFFGST